jgi:predicted DNA-binding protein (UPF0251 family)
MTPDLFATAPSREPSPRVDPPATAKPETPSPRIVLPKDLSAALKRLDDQELRRLSRAVAAEEEARGGAPAAVAEKTTEQKRVETAPIALSTGKINAVRAAFKAGVKPAQIARQFGVSQADVRKVLASDAKKRGG